MYYTYEWMAMVFHRVKRISIMVRLSTAESHIPASCSSPPGNISWFLRFVGVVGCARSPALAIYC